MNGVIAAFFMFLVANSCAHKKNVVINQDSIQPGTNINYKGKPIKLHAGNLSVGDNFVQLMKKTDVEFEFGKKVSIVNIVPSIDTKVCEEQTHVLGESKEISSHVDRITISRDLPMAQERFSKAAKLENIKYLSDFNTASFGKMSGLLIKEWGLLARGVLVIDSNGVIQYMQIVSEVTELPDMQKAIRFANDLVFQ